ncbi:MAG: hypothetical protein M3N49_04705 [Candidatus Eremiobacteraeota bacterium]|nr:hypothetical protein [Candidatus Eremiobacteraeota bacterium]
METASLDWVSLAYCLVIPFALYAVAMERVPPWRRWLVRQHEEIPVVLVALVAIAEAVFPLDAPLLKVGVIALSAGLAAWYIGAVQHRKRSDTERDRARHEEVRAAQRATEARARRDCVSKTAELLRGLDDLLNPFISARQRFDADPGNVEGIKAKLEASSDAVSRFIESYAVTVGLIFLEYRDQYGMDTKEASAILSGKIETADQIVTLTNILNGLAVDLLSKSAKQ